MLRAYWSNGRSKRSRALWTQAAFFFCFDPNICVLVCGSEVLGAVNPRPSVCLRETFQNFCPPDLSGGFRGEDFRRASAGNACVHYRSKGISARRFCRKLETALDSRILTA